MASGDKHSCAGRKRDGLVICWGNNDAGQTHMPEEVLGYEIEIEVVGAQNRHTIILSLGVHHSCAVVAGIL